MSAQGDDPHGDQPLETAGEPLDAARAAVVLVHGRGATARGMLGLADELAVDPEAEGIALLAPQAQRGTWYPQSFLADLDANEPWLSSALAKVGDAIQTAVDTGVDRERTMLVGFSQGACLSSEFLARNARRYGGLGVLSGGLIGPEGTPRDYDGSLDGTPIFLGCSDRDPHVPAERVSETTEVFEELGGAVDERIYEGMGHTVNQDELAAVSEMVADLTE
ncbi:alpha/beta hydrolase [Halorussus sp. GCM10023401]|uniref:alpha/beta hydrolase n=1 Tax=Halorussus sp. GCM10023401 TaxID=3252680 RepID=UPI003623E575